MPQAAQRAIRRDAQEAILDAAEQVFADNGFHGATTRAIAELAGANAALIHYYFGSKEALFETVFARRSDAINAERRNRLAALQAAGQSAGQSAGAPTLEQVLDALLRPTVALGHDPARGGAHYARLLVHVAAGTDARSRRLTGASYDAIARLFIDAIAAAVPGLERASAVHCYLNTIAIGIALMAPTGRAQNLMPRQPAPRQDPRQDPGPDAAPDDLDRVLARTVRFIAAGIRAMAMAPTR
ncbi:MAG: TetR family transcriptional regulator [Pararhodobacter sp.]|nr:TetR family transcriptional regulator [Pararhodobacter sp.]